MSHLQKNTDVFKKPNDLPTIYNKNLIFSKSVEMISLICSWNVIRF